MKIKLLLVRLIAPAFTNSLGSTQASHEETPDSFVEKKMDKIGGECSRFILAPQTPNVSIRVVEKEMLNIMRTPALAPCNPYR